MTRIDELTNAVRDRLRDRFPVYPLDVCPSAEDEQVLCVRIFAVPEGSVDTVEDAVFEVEEELARSHGIVLLPMVKDLDTTREYYPQHVPVRVTEERDPLASWAFIVRRLAQEWHQETMQPVSHSGMGHFSAWYDSALATDLSRGNRHQEEAVHLASALAHLTSHFTESLAGATPHRRWVFAWTEWDLGASFPKPRDPGRKVAADTELAFAKAA